MSLQYAAVLNDVFNYFPTEIPPDIVERVIEGAATVNDASELLKCEPGVIFKFADMLKASLVGNSVSYIVNRNITFSDNCTGTCTFCAFKGYKGFRMGVDEIVRTAAGAVQTGATEVCIQGGLMDDMHLENYCNILRSIKSRFPQLHIHAFSPMEVFHMSRNSDTSIKDTLLALKNNGLDSMPGTAAEILSDRVRKEICPDKLTSSQWINVVETAHRTGIPTTATMMYGHIETMTERIHHILTVRDIQLMTGGFTEFVPLPFMPYNNPLGKRLMAEGYFATTGVEDLIVHALARILLYPHVSNIQASWVKLGKKLAQYALFCGVNDLGGTLMEESISKSAGAANGEYMPSEEFQWIIRGAGRDPVQRDTLYRQIVTG
ncbi:MAG: 5-amino-6-(D-ribitylamino)uracil--L-tyrosine 4-hydroxyphenyl transferase CofH [ANME-2 cluster archaeon]|nr:5-amino-6-(D-ribitylamino)uracil--L-tyrosine 4-hydroxyphenyl transferase CofH [ANME-2 cluster archaeon]